MKKYLLTIAMAITLGATVLPAAPKHRHNVTVTLNADSNAAGIEAYSDTTSVTQADGDSVKAATVSYGSSDMDADDVFSHMMSTPWIFVLVITFAFLLAISPFLLLALLLRLLIKRHNDKVALAEKSMAMGQMPQPVMAVDKYSKEYQWNRGIRNASIGAGLMILFWCIDATALIGVGGLILCMGIGQMFIAKTSPEERHDNNDFTDLTIR